MKVSVERLTDEEGSENFLKYPRPITLQQFAKQGALPMVQGIKEHN